MPACVTSVAGPNKGGNWGASRGTTRVVDLTPHHHAAQPLARPCFPPPARTLWRRPPAVVPPHPAVAVYRARRTDGTSGGRPLRQPPPTMAIPSMVSNATKTGYYLVLLVMSLTVMGYTAERCVILDDDNPGLECSRRAHAVLSMGTISAAFCLCLVVLFYAGLHTILKGEVFVAVILVGLWAATASLVSSPRTFITDGVSAPNPNDTFDGSAAFYTAWIGLVFAVLLAYWAAADVGLKPPLPADAPDAAAGGSTASSEHDEAAEPIKPAKDEAKAAGAPAPAAVAGGDVEAVSEAV